MRLGGGMEALLSEYGEEYDAMMQELSIYKVRIENILCETDIKEQDHLPMDRHTQVNTEILKTHPSRVRSVSNFQRG